MELFQFPFRFQTLATSFTSSPTFVPVQFAAAIQQIFVGANNESNKLAHKRKTDTLLSIRCFR
jgi:hypothetical protein